METSPLNYGANPNEANEASGKLDLEDLKFLIRRKYQNLMDRCTIYPKERWIGLAVLLVLFAFRVYVT